MYDETTSVTYELSLRLSLALSRRTVNCIVALAAIAAITWGIFR